MLGPRPPATWTGRDRHPPARSYGSLQPGHTYEVRAAFVDHDGSEHPIGERWVFLGYSYLPYDDGLSLFVSLDGYQEWHIRLQDRDDEQGDIVRALDDVYLVEAAEPIARVARPGLTATEASAPRRRSLAARAWAAVARRIGLR